MTEDTLTAPDSDGTAEPADYVCSGKGCRAPARHAVVWRNPKIHTAERRKVWLACDDHREHLAHFVDARGFLIEVIGVGELTDRDG